MEILNNRLKVLTKQREYILCELSIKDNVNPDFILYEARKLQEIENRITEVNTIILLYTDKQI